MVGLWIYALCSGGGCLSDCEALNDDPLAREFFGVGKFAGPSQIGPWLPEQPDPSEAPAPMDGAGAVPGAWFCGCQRWAQRV